MDHRARRRVRGECLRRSQGAPPQCSAKIEGLEEGARWPPRPSSRHRDSSPRVARPVYSSGVPVVHHADDTLTAAHSTLPPLCYFRGPTGRFLARWSGPGGPGDAPEPPGITEAGWWRVRDSNPRPLESLASRAELTPRGHYNTRALCFVHWHRGGGRVPSRTAPAELYVIPPRAVASRITSCGHSSRSTRRMKASSLSAA